MSNFKHFLLILFIATFPSAHAQVLWDNWYTETTHGHPTGYYNEKAEIVGNKAKIQVNRWIKEGQKIRSEALGAVAKNTELLEPLLYDYRTQTPEGQEKVIDGSISGKTFSVKIKTGVTTGKPIKAEMLPKLILSADFPLWIHQNYKAINGAQPKEFSAILEDHVDSEVPVVTGSAYETLQDDFAKQTKTRKLRIEFGHLVQWWWVTPKGDAIKIQCNQTEVTVLKTNQKTAENHLSQP